MKTYHKSADAIAKLDAEQYHVTQESGTEQSGTGKYLHNQEPGIYVVDAVKQIIANDHESRSLIDVESIELTLLIAYLCR